MGNGLIFRLGFHWIFWIQMKLLQVRGSVRWDGKFGFLEKTTEKNGERNRNTINSSPFRNENPNKASE